MQDRVLVTGGSGFIGNNLVRRLVRLGYNVRVLDDNSRGTRRRLTDVMNDIELIHGDVRDADVVDRAVRDVDIVAHLSFINGTEYFYTKPRLVLEVGVKGVLHTLESAIRHDVREYWYMSSSEVYQSPPAVPTDESVGFHIPDPLNPRYSYAGAKIISELMAVNYGRGQFERTVIVRPHNVYGPDMGWEHVIPQLLMRAERAAREHPQGAVPVPIQGDGSQRRTFVYIDDFLDGALLAYIQGEPLGIYHVGTMVEHTIADLVSIIVSHLGREARIIPGDLPKGGTTRRCPDTRKIAALGYAPKVDLREGVRRTAEWYLENSNAWPG